MMVAGRKQDTDRQRDWGRYGGIMHGAARQQQLSEEISSYGQQERSR